MTELRRDLGVFAALAIVVGTVIGSGIFRVPQAMILNVGSVRLVFLVWVAGGMLSLAGALTYAELAAAMPGAGGEYVYLTEAYGPLWGFLYSWTQMWVAKSGSIATLATAFFEYTAHFVPQFEQVLFTAGPFSVKYGQMFALYRNGDSFYSFKIVKQHETSGRAHLLSALEWLQRHGYIGRSDTLTQVDFGWEIASTVGRNMDFTVTRYWLATGFRKH